MTSGAEAFKAAVRRSALLIVALVVLGAAAVITIRQVQGSRYEASARVLIQQQSLGEAITGTQAQFVDPQRAEAMSTALGHSPELYKRAADATKGSLGTADDLQAATSVSSGADNILTFTATAPEAQRAVGIANATAAAYIVWRADVLGKPVARAIDEVKAKLAQSGTSGAATADLQKQLNTLEVLRTLNNDATLVDRADSAAKTRPTPVKDGLLGAAIGLVVALLLVAAREAIDTTVRSESDVEDILGAPVLASVRTLPRRTKLVTFGRHDTVFGDTYALLAATLTSAVSSEGKTTTAANLAIALARRGQRVILADFDFRKASVGDLFGIPHESPGTLQVLAGKVPAPAAVWGVTLDGRMPEVAPIAGANGAGPQTAKTPGVGRLWVLPAGGTDRAGVSANRLMRLLDELREHADFVVLDTPPALLTAEMADIADQIDSALIVVRSGRVTHRSLRSLSRQARTWGTRIEGAILTDVPGEETYGYYGGR
jgi:Mrp family chromosome partitioning ATPase/capsular polysaccharide biosynthesis protein